MPTRRTGEPDAARPLTENGRRAGRARWRDGLRRGCPGTCACSSRPRCGRRKRHARCGVNSRRSRRLAPGCDVAAILDAADWPRRRAAGAGRRPPADARRSGCATPVDGRHGHLAVRHVRAVLDAEHSAQGPQRSDAACSRCESEILEREWFRHARASARDAVADVAELHLDARGVARAHAQQQLAARRFRLERRDRRIRRARSAASA